MPIGAFRLNTLSAALSQANSITATGGTASYFNISGTTYKLHIFTTTGSNSFTVSATTGSPTIDLLLVGGGGAGGGTISSNYVSAGGGGAGNLIYQTGLNVSSSQSYSVTVGAGGTGVSGADGGAGSFSGFYINGTPQYVANGGGQGTLGSAATNGGGSGINTSTGYTSTAGTYPYKGGNSIYGGALTAKAGGGGAGAGGAGVDATASNGGAGGLPIQNNIDGNNSYYAGGGGGSGASAGQAYGTNGILSSAGSLGSGRSTAGSGNSNTTGTYGGGGGGAATFGTAATQAGGSGRQGIAMIRYPLATPFTLSYVTSATSTSSTITIPATAQTGDLVMLFDCAYNNSTTVPTAVTPTGFTQHDSANQAVSPASRGTILWKILVAGDAGSSITGMNGATNQKTIVVYRPSSPINSIDNNTGSRKSTANTSAPTNQTSSTGSAPTWYLMYGLYSSTGSITTRGTTVTETREIANGTTQYIKMFEAINGTTTFSGPTISMADYGSNILGTSWLGIS